MIALGQFVDCVWLSPPHVVLRLLGGGRTPAESPGCIGHGRPLAAHRQRFHCGAANL